MDKRYTFNEGFVCFFSAFILSIYINLFGSIYLGEIIGIFYILTIPLVLSKEMKRAVFYAFVWVAAQFISDQINSIAFQFSLKGISAPLLMITTVIFFTKYYLKSEQNLVFFFLGTLIASTTISFVNDSGFILENLWKWGIGAPLNLLFAIWFSYFNKESNRKILIGYTLFFFAVSNFFSARSMGGICLFSTVFYFLMRNNRVSSYLKNIVTSQFGMGKIVASLVVIMLLLNSLFTVLFTSDFYLSRITDEAARSKAEKQANNQYGAILGGRSESLISIQAFLDKPFFGHGSWAKDDGNYIEQYIDIVDDLDISEGVGGANWARDLGLIPTHSYLMGAIVWGGFFAGLFWLFIMGRIIKMLMLHGDNINYFCITIFLAFFWDILFSPFGFPHRWGSAIKIAIFFYYENKFSKKK